MSALMVEPDRQATTCQERRLMEALRRGEISRHLAEDADLSRFSEGELREVFNRALRVGNLSHEALLSAACGAAPLEERQVLCIRLAQGARRCLEAGGRTLRTEDFEIRSLCAPGDGDPWPMNAAFPEDRQFSPPVRHLGRTA